MLSSSPEFWNRLNGFLFLSIFFSLGWLIFESQQEHQSKSALTYFAIADTSLQKGQLAFLNQNKQLEQQISQKAKAYQYLSKYGKQCEEICFLTHHCVEQLTKLKQEVIQVSGGQEEHHALVAVANTDIVQDFIRLKKKALLFENKQLRQGLLAEVKDAAKQEIIQDKLRNSRIEGLWDSQKFEYAPLQALIGFLENEIIHIQQLEYTLLSDVNQQAAVKRLEYDQYLPALSGRSRISQGERYKGEIYLVPYTASDSSMMIKVNGKSLPIQDGKATYTTKSRKKGTNNFEVSIAVQEPMNDTITTYQKSFEFTVAGN